MAQQSTPFFQKALVQLPAPTSRLTTAFPIPDTYSKNTHTHKIRIKNIYAIVTFRVSKVRVFGNYVTWGTAKKEWRVYLVKGSKLLQARNIFSNMTILNSGCRGERLKFSMAKQHTRQGRTELCWCALDYQALGFFDGCRATKIREPLT